MQGKQNADQTTDAAGGKDFAAAADFVADIEQHQRRAVQRAPQQKVPALAVPDAREQHRQHQVDLGAGEAVAAAAQRNVDVVAYPGGQGDVPAVPKIADIVGAQRHIEVFRQPETEQHRHADYQVAVAGKVHKQLHGVAVHRRQHRGRVVLQRVFKNRIDPAFAQRAGQPPFFGNAQHNQRYRQRRFHHIARRGGADLLGHARFQAAAAAFEGGGADNRAGSDGGKEAEVQQLLQGAQPRTLAAIERDEIGDALKGVVGNAQRHQDVRQRAAAVLLQQRAEKVGEFEKYQIGQRQHHARAQPPAAGGGRAAAGQQLRQQRNGQRKRRQRQRRQRGDINQPAQAGGQQQQVLQARRRPAQPIKRQKQQKKQRKFDR